MRNQNIAKVLKEYRKRNHLSVNDVSILLEDRSFTAAPKTIYGWESGQANPSADILLTLCDLFSKNSDFPLYCHHSPPEKSMSSALTQFQVNPSVIRQNLHMDM